MAMIPTRQIEGDRRLLLFNSYEDYLDSLTTPADLCYLQSTEAARAIAELGYRSSGETLTREAFERRLAAVTEYVFPSRKPYLLCSEGMRNDEPLHQELALRERSNRVGLLATIIFLRHFTKAGFEISGYIDYAEKLVSDDWTLFFKGQKRLWPQTNDLGYYHWRIGKSTCNDTRNYKAIVDPQKGLLFQNKHDRLIVCPDPGLSSPGSNTTRTRIFTDKYEHVVLYDHVVRSKC